jgi:ABC-type amino acid transport substrate-binding protein
MALRILAVLIALMTSLCNQAQAASNQPIYDRVMKTQTIRCGYAEWAPFMTIDPNTKQIGGMFKEIWENMGRKLGLKIEWTTIVGWGEITEALNSKKIDAFCLVVWPDAGRMKNLLLSRPVFYMPVYLFARGDDKRFDNNYSLLNDPKYTIVGQDGDVTASVLEAKFPQAKTAHIPPIDQQGSLFTNVINKKGDVTIADIPFATDVMKSNPGKLRQVAGEPVQIMQSVMPLAVGETQMKSMIDTALTDMINDGTIAALIKQYGAQQTYAPQPDVMIGK